MALIRCPECKKKFSDKASVCPGCGAPRSLAIEADKIDRQKKNALLAIAGVVVLFVIFSGGEKDTPHASGEMSSFPATQPTESVDASPAPGASQATSTVSESVTSKPIEPEAPRSQWRYQSNKDEMRGVTNRWATLTSDNTLSLEFPYSGGSSLRIVVRSMPKKYGQDVMLEISRGQLDCGFDGCKVPVKFDDNPIISYTATRADGGNSDTIFIREQSGFLRRIKASKSVTIEVPVWKYGSAQYRFSSAGLEWK